MKAFIRAEIQRTEQWARSFSTVFLEHQWPPPTARGIVFENENFKSHLCE